MRGRHSQKTIALDAATRATLESWLRRQTIAAGLATRARAILLLAEGQPDSHTARQVGLTERHVHKWGQRFVTAGLAGWEDRPRPGRPPSFPPGGSAACGQDGL